MEIWSIVAFTRVELEVIITIPERIDLSEDQSVKS